MKRFMTIIAMLCLLNAHQITIAMESKETKTPEESFSFEINGKLLRAFERHDANSENTLQIYMYLHKNQESWGKPTKKEGADYILYSYPNGMKEYQMPFEGGMYKKIYMIIKDAGYGARWQLSPCLIISNNPNFTNDTTRFFMLDQWPLPTTFETEDEISSLISSETRQNRYIGASGAYGRSMEQAPATTVSTAQTPSSVTPSSYSASTSSVSAGAVQSTTTQPTETASVSSSSSNATSSTPLTQETQALFSSTVPAVAALAMTTLTLETKSAH